MAEDQRVAGKAKYSESRDTSIRAFIGSKVMSRRRLVAWLQYYTPALVRPKLRLGFGFWVSGFSVRVRVAVKIRVSVYGLTKI